MNINILLIFSGGGNLKSVSLTGGEPSLIQNLPEIVSIFKNEGYNVRMTSNAFLLDDFLKQQLKKAGLDAINISLSTLKTDEHNKMFNVKDKLPTVLENLKSLSQNFPKQVKINFMALEGINVPEQLLPISELSAKLGITISFLTTLDNDKTISLHVLEYLKKHLNIVTEKEIESKFGKKTIYTFDNGSAWEFDDFRGDQYKEIAFDNDECQNCSYRKNCVEGPYALRISYNGDIRPCLIRKDNIISLTKGVYFDEQ